MGNCLAAPRQAIEEEDLFVTPKGGKPKEREQQGRGTKEAEIPCVDKEQLESKPEDEPAKGLPHQAEKLGPPVPPCEKDRLATIRATNPRFNLDSPPDPEVESILKLCQSIFQCPNALVALFDDKRVFIREATGAFSRGDFPWRFSFCGWTMASSCHQIMVVPDALEDSRFENNKFVKELGVRFYCGTPLVGSSGHRLGTLCFADFSPRTNFDACQAQILNNLAEMVVRQVEKDMQLQMRRQANEEANKMCAKLKRAADCVDDCVALVDISQPGWRILYVNGAWDKIMGSSRGRVTNALLQNTLQLSLNSPDGACAGREGRSLSLPQPAHVSAVKAGKEVVIQGAVLIDTDSAYNSGAFVLERNSSSPEKGARRPPVVLSFRPAFKGAFKTNTLPVGVPSFIPCHSTAAGTPSTEHLYFMFVEPAQSKRPKAKAVQPSSFIPRNVSFQTDNLDSDPGLLWDSAGANSWSTSIKGLELGQLLGSGSFGSVYRADLYGMRVAVKVINENIKTDADSSLEAVLGATLRHPCIISILKVMVRRMGSSPGSSNRSSQSQLSCPSPYTKPETLERSGGYQDNEPSLTQQQERRSRLRQTRQPQHQEQQRWEEACRKRQEELQQCKTMTDDLEPIQIQGKALTAGAWPVLQKMGGMDEGDDEARESDSFNLWDCMTPSLSSNTVAPTVPSQTWLVMEYCDKGCLQDAVDRGWLRTCHPNGQPKMMAIIATAYEVASALTFLHRKGIVHGDMSPYNVLLTSSGPCASAGGRKFVAKLSDFGLSRALNIASRITTKTYGTLTHQPPETLAEGIISRATDIYSFGVLLWSMYTGSRPWAGLSHAQIVGNVAGRREHLHMPPAIPEAHQAFAQLTMQCLDYETRNRPSTEGIIAALEVMQHGA